MKDQELKTEPGSEPTGPAQGTSARDQVLVVLQEQLIVLRFMGRTGCLPAEKARLLEDSVKAAIGLAAETDQAPPELTHNVIQLLESGSFGQAEPPRPRSYVYEFPAFEMLPEHSLSRNILYSGTGEPMPRGATDALAEALRELLKKWINQVPVKQRSTVDDLILDVLKRIDALKRNPNVANFNALLRKFVALERAARRAGVDTKLISYPSLAALMKNLGQAGAVSATLLAQLLLIALAAYLGFKLGEHVAESPVRPGGPTYAEFWGHAIWGLIDDGDCAVLQAEINRLSDLILRMKANDAPKSELAKVMGENIALISKFLADCKPVSRGTYEKELARLTQALQDILSGD